MLDVFCPNHGGPVLLTSRHLLGLERRPEGYVVHFKCWCGLVGSDLIYSRSPLAQVRPVARVAL